MKPTPPLTTESNAENHQTVGGRSASDCSAWIYHYCAQHQLADGAIAMIDGIAALRSQITGWEDYQNLKAEIVKDIHPKVPVWKLTVVSLTLISKPNTGAQATQPNL